MKCLALVLICGLLTLAACDGTDDLCQPEVPGGRLEGHVTAGGLPFNATIVATRLVDGEPADPLLEAVPDLAGRYSLDVPAGDYQVSVRFASHRHVYDYTGELPGYGNVPPKTLRIDQAASPVTVDFALGGMIVDVALSDRLDDEACEVRLHRSDEDPSDGWRTYVNAGSATITDGRAEVYVAGVLPGEYRVQLVLGPRHYQCYCPYDGEHVWLPGTRDPEAASWYTVEADDHAYLACTLTDQPARLEGRVTGAWQEFGQDPPELSIVTTDSLLVMGARRVTEDGSFAIDLHLADTVKLLVTHAGVPAWIGGPEFADARVFPLELGATTAGIEHVQSGLRVRLDSPAAWIGYAGVEFIDATTQELAFQAVLEIWGDHHFGIPNLWPGEFLMKISPQTWDRGRTVWRPQWFDRAAAMEAAQPIVIPATGDIVVLDLVLELGGAIGGRLTRGPGAADSYHVIATPADNRVPWGAAYVFAPAEEFAVLGLPDGDYKVGVWPTQQGWSPPNVPPGGTVWYPGTHDWEAAAVLEIRDAEEVSGVEITFPLPVR